MESISEFLEMGGYAAYVWSSYLLTAAVLIAMLVASIRFLKNNESTLSALKGKGVENNDEA